MRVLLISPEAWGLNFVSKHHYARFLAEGHEVIFLNPASGHSRFPFGDMSIGKEEVLPNLHVVSYRNLVPKLNHFPLFMRRWIYRLQARRLIGKTGPVDLVWSFDPRRFTDQRVWGAKKTIYHSVDLHPDADEKFICHHSDLVIGLSDIICAHLRQFRPDVIRVEHASHIDPVNEHPRPVTLPGNNPVKALYTGNFHRHIDYGLLIRLAEQNRDVDFILIGPTEPNNLSPSTLRANELEQLRSQENIFMLGSRPASELYHYIAAADICLVLFKREFELIHHAPHKLMAYFAAGKVVLSNYIDAHKESSESLIRMTGQENLLNEFARIKSNLAHWNSDHLSNTRKQYAAQHHYRLKIIRIFEFAGI